MHEAFIDVADVPTHVMSWGHWIEEAFDRKEVVICITGNPGIVGFYKKFVSCISDTIGQDIPIWLIGHAGHDEPPARSIRKVPLLAGNENLYSLQAQVKHKAKFIKKYVPDDVKVHLIGHSLGAWIITRLLKEPEIQRKVQHSYLLFPVIERMAESTNGLQFVNVIQPYYSWLRTIFVTLSMLPTAIRTVLTRIYLFMTSTPQHFIDDILMYVKPTVLDKIFYMSKDEMEQIVELDVDTIEKNKDIIKLYYGHNDRWVLPECVQQLRERIPNVDAVVDSKNINHAFVLNDSEVMAMGTMVGEWIQSYRRN